MSQDLPKDNLAQVLNRINTITKHQEPGEDAIPVLTQVFDGETNATGSADIPVLSEVAEVELLPSHSLNTDVLLAEMLPQIQAAVRAALKVELASMESRLASKLELELMEALKAKLLK